jgi:hypothetical protein
VWLKEDSMLLLRRWIGECNTLPCVLRLDRLLTRLDMLTTLTPTNVKDLRLSGQVIYTGKSSMEIVVKWEALGQDHSEETIMVG